MNTISFIRRHPKLKSYCISILVYFNKVLLSVLNRSMLSLILLKGLNPNPPPSPPPPPEPKVDDAFKNSTRRKVYIGMPHVPHWVAESFTNQKVHPINEQRKRIYEKAKAAAEADAAAEAALASDVPKVVEELTNVDSYYDSCTTTTSEPEVTEEKTSKKKKKNKR